LPKERNKARKTAIEAICIPLHGDALDVGVKNIFGFHCADM